MIILRLAPKPPQTADGWTLWWAWYPVQCEDDTVRWREYVEYKGFQNGACESFTAYRPVRTSNAPIGPAGGSWDTP